jgi:Protein of unknown function (DUF1615)
LRAFDLPPLDGALPQRQPRRSRGAARRRSRLPPLLAFGAGVVGATLLAVSCQRHLTPPPASHKPAHYRPAGTERSAQAPIREAARPEAGATLASARTEPVTPPSAAPFYDEQRPCFSATQMAQARAVLFSADPGTWGERWLHGINGAFFDLNVPCGDDGFLVLVLTTIQLESGVTVDPGLENPDLEALFTFHLQQLRQDNPVAGRLLNYSGLDQAMQAKLRADTRKGLVRTEADLVRYVETDLRAWLREYLQSHYFLPASVARYAADQGLPNPVHTIGPMQVNLHKAFENARARGETVASEAQMRDWLLTRKTAMERGIKEGVYQLWRIYRFYRRSLPPDEAVRFTTADYNAGEFSSRNAAYQQRLSVLTERRLVLDGDLLAYQGGQAAERVSNTEAATILLLSEYAAPNIRQDLLLEKSEAFSASRTALKVCERYRARTGQDCSVATLPIGAANEVARVKLGRAYTPANYSRAYVKRWEENLARFGQS